MSKQPTIADLREHADALEAKFGAGANIAYSNISQTQFSIARHYGQIKVNGHKFIYNPLDDSLIREDVAKWLGKQKKKEQKK